MVENLPPMRPVHDVKVTVLNPLRAANLFWEGVYLVVAVVALLLADAQETPGLMASVVGLWVIWTGFRLWRGHRKWRAWRDGPPVVHAGTPGGSPRSR